MKTLKTVTVLIFTAALFFSCQENINDYGTLVINPSGNSARVTGVVSDDRPGTEQIKSPLQKEVLSYLFECINEKDGTTTVAGPYGVEMPYDVTLQLTPGEWVVWVKVFENGYGIGSASYGSVKIKAGQTVILRGISVKVSSKYGKGEAKMAPFNFDDRYSNVNDPAWGDAIPLLINRFLTPIADGQPPVNKKDHKLTTIAPYSPAPYGTANILWNDVGGNRYLYVRVLVKDADLSATNGSEHNSNSVEIFFNEDGTGHQYRMDSDGDITYSYYNSTGHHKEPVGVLPANVELLIEKDNLPNGVSYAVIANIPIKSKKQIIGVDLQINGIKKTSSSTIRRTSIAVWYDGQVYDNPGAYATSLTLVP